MEDSRIWLITGCSSGLGKALALAALAGGDKVAATCRNPEDLAGLEGAWPDQCRVLPLDVTDTRQVTETAALAAAEWGRVDVLVNNAGHGLLGALEEYSTEQVERSLRTHFLGPMELIRAVLPVLRRQQSGHVINISAAAAIANYPGFSAYGAAKAALEAASESLRAEVAPFGIKVTIVQPGPFRTEFISRSMERAASPMPEYDGTSGKFAQMLARMDGRQTGDPEKAAQAVVAMVKSGKAPLRLPLGKYAIKKTRDRAAAMLRELEEWEVLAGGTDY